MDKKYGYLNQRPMTYDLRKWKSIIWAGGYSGINNERKSFGVLLFCFLYLFFIPVFNAIKIWKIKFILLYILTGNSFPQMYR